MRRKYHVIADENTVLGFQCAGVPGTAVNNNEEATKALASARTREVGIVVLTEEVADMMRDEVDAIRFGEELPMIVEIPSAQGPMPGRRTLPDIIREAIGIKV